MDDVALEQIQVKIAFLERANSELSDVVARQQQEIRALTARLTDIVARLGATQAADDERPAEHERPPHY
jgi:SlyX protein